jgi:preprotein translocase subunit YajC
MVLLQDQGAGGGMSMLIMMGGMFIIMYFFMIRPQMKKAKEAKKFQDSLEIGDKVMTLGGIHGKIVEIGETDVVMAIDQGRLRIEKAGISPNKQMDAQTNLETQNKK